MPLTNPVSKYRKKFGKIDKCLKQPGTACVMNVEGNNVKFNNDDDVAKAHDNGVLSDSAFAKYQETQPDKKIANTTEDKNDTRNKVHTVTSDQVNKDEM